jgi:TPR repeat protein
MLTGAASMSNDSCGAAVSWYRKAAEQGDRDSQSSLWQMYRYGHGVPQDFAAAANWLRKAAEQDSADAQFTLGIMYFQRGAKDYVIGHLPARPPSAISGSGG